MAKIKSPKQEHDEKVSSIMKKLSSNVRNDLKSMMASAKTDDILLTVSPFVGKKFLEFLSTVPEPEAVGSPADVCGSMPHLPAGF